MRHDWHPQLLIVMLELILLIRVVFRELVDTDTKLLKLLSNLKKSQMQTNDTYCTIWNNINVSTDTHTQIQIP